MSISLNEARAFSEINSIARSLEPALMRSSYISVSESMKILAASPLAEEIQMYDEHIFTSEAIVAKLDQNILRSGRDPFHEWLLENQQTYALVEYQALLEAGIWDSLKSAAKSVAGGLEKSASWVGAQLKDVGSAFLRQFPWGQKVIDFLKALTEGGSAIGIAQLLLDIIGAIPGSWIGIPIDTVANLINAIIYFGRGMYLNGVFSLLFMLPLGNWLKAAKFTFIKPFTKLAEITKGVATGNSALVKKAGAEMVKLEGSRTFLNQIGKYVNTLGRTVKNVIGQVLLVFQKFLPDSWVASIEKWMTSNLIGPVQSTENAIKIATEYVEKGGGKNLSRLEKGGEKALATDLEKTLAKAKQGAEVTTATGGKAVTKRAGTILADEAADIATKVTGKISPAKLSEMVIADNKAGISRLFGQAATDAGLSAAQKELMTTFARNPEVFIECHKLSKRLFGTIRNISKLAGPRKLIKLSRLARAFIRNYLKTELACFEFGPNASFYSLASQYPDTTSPMHEAEDPYEIPDSAISGGENNSTANADEETQLTMKQLGQLQFKEASPEVQADAKKQIAENDKLGPCATVPKQSSTSLGNAYVDAMMTQTPYGDYKTVSDEQATARFEQTVNPTLERLGIPPVKEYVYEHLYRMGTHERSKYIDVYDPVKKVIAPTTSVEEENQRFEDFIKDEVKRTGLPESRVRAIVNQTKKENHQLDLQLQDSTENKNENLPR